MFLVLLVCLSLCPSLRGIWDEEYILAMIRITIWLQDLPPRSGLRSEYSIRITIWLQDPDYDLNSVSRL